MSIVVFGAGGILGQEMMFNSSCFVDMVFCKKSPGFQYEAIDITNRNDVNDFLQLHKPTAVINLAGENRVDIVESDPERFYDVNVGAVETLANACNSIDAHFVQVSTQGIFSGNSAPYGPDSPANPITKYGKQKLESEFIAAGVANSLSIARVTFVLGIRKSKIIGRKNPLEQMLEMQTQKQVNDRWFSPAIASDAARHILDLAEDREEGTFHIGEPITLSRYDVAKAVLGDRYSVEPVSHSYFEGIAPRPVDTTWAQGSLYYRSFYEYAEHFKNEWNMQQWT